MEDNRQHNEIFSKLGNAESSIAALLKNQTMNGEKIDKILEQTIKTNGRVTNVEQFIIEQHKINSKLDGLLATHWVKIEEQEKRHSYSMGILKVLGIVGGIVLIVGGYFFSLVVKDISKNTVKEVLSERQANQAK